MLPLFDMMANAQNGQAMQALARQFGLSPEQTQAALEALLPAFSQGLKRSTSDPYGLAAFMTAIANGQHRRAFDDAGFAFSPQGVAEGNDVLGRIFGSKEFSRAVADQAAQMTGIGHNVLLQMLPVIATMLMGGFFKQASGQLGPQPAGSGNVLADILNQMMQGGAAQGSRQTSHRNADPFDNPFGRAMRDMFGAARTGQGTAMGDNPLSRIFADMLGGARPAPQPEPDPKANPSGRSRNPYDELFGTMFEAGENVRDDYRKTMESAFDQFLKSMSKP